MTRKLWMVAPLVVACLPADPPGFHRDGGRVLGRTAKATASLKAGSEHLPNASASPGTEASDPAHRPIDEALNEDFNRPELGPEWTATSGVWHLEDGRLCAKGARNHPVWFNRRLPKNARIEFDATSGSAEGDIKAEAWGDGQHVPRGNTYDDATSYVVILGGWRNRLDVLARLNEHGKDRRELRLVPGSEDPRTEPVIEGRSYHVEIERGDGRTVRVRVDDNPLFTFEDPAPLVGPDHEHFAFNDWEVPVCFDDLLVTPLED